MTTDNKTLKQIRANEVANALQKEILVEYNRLGDITANVKNGSMRAARARKEFAKSMERASFYHRLLNPILTKYNIAPQISIVAFESYIKFYMY